MESYIKASFLDRVTASIIDILIFIISIIFLIFFDASFSFPLSQSFEYFIYLLSVIYNVILLNWQGATLGKKIMKLRVVTTSYKKLPLKNILLRETIGKWLSGIFNLGYFWMIIDQKGQTWHDKIAGSFVVKVNANGQLIKGTGSSVTRKPWIIFSLLFLTIGLLVILGPLFISVYLYLIQPFKASGNAMSPTFQNDQYFLTEKFTYKNTSPQRGDVIVFKYPKDKSREFFKRVIGLPGENIKIREGRVYINNSPLDEPYLSPNTTTYPGIFLQNDEVTIPADNYFVLGDNRNHSSDSREWGFVSKENIVGKFWFKY